MVDLPVNHKKSKLKIRALVTQSVNQVIPSDLKFDIGTNRCPTILKFYRQNDPETLSRSLHHVLPWSGSDHKPQVRILLTTESYSQN